MSRGDDARREASARIEELLSRTLYLPLTGDASRPFATVLLPDGRKALAVFTSREALHAGATLHGLYDRSGEIRPGEAPGRLALGYLARAALHAVIVDPASSAPFVVARDDVDEVLARNAPPKRSSASFQAATRPAPAAAEIRVLVVDDDATILTMVKRFLASRGADVEVSSSALGVSGLVSRQRPTVLVLDVSMPALDGVGLASLVRTSAHPPAIVFFSAVDGARLDEIAASVPGAERVSKTAGLDALWATIQRAHRSVRRA